MNNPKIEIDIAEIFGEIKQELKSINNRLEKIEVDITEIKTNQSNVKEQIGEIKGSQKAQIWALIVILATSLLGILVAVGKILFFN